MTKWHNAASRQNARTAGRLPDWRRKIAAINGELIEWLFRAPGRVNDTTLREIAETADFLSRTVQKELERRSAEL